MSKLAERVKTNVEEGLAAESEEIHIQNKGDVDHIVSTGSTLLDLTFSGGRVEEGGVPGGIILEIFGPPSIGKTAVLSEICASAQKRNGKVRFLDPEARLDEEYSRIYGIELDKTDYHRPDTVKEVFDIISSWEAEDSPPKSCNVIATDSLAALSSELELSEKGDKMGMRIAKDFSEGLRKTCRLIRKKNWLIACTNQTRMGDMTETTPGGKGIPFYASLRLKMFYPKDRFLDKTVQFHGKDQKKITGVRSICEVVKSSVDDPYRKCEIFIIFGYGIDDIRGNLQWLKNVTNANVYSAVDKDYQQFREAVNHVEKNNLQEDLRRIVIKEWRELNERFSEKRPPKARF